MNRLLFIPLTLGLSLFMFSSCEGNTSVKSESKSIDKIVDTSEVQNPIDPNTKLIEKADSLFQESAYHQAKILYDSLLNLTKDEKQLIHFKERILNCEVIIDTPLSPVKMAEESLLGIKSFGVQFIWDSYGKATIEKKNEEIHFSGEQFSDDKSEYLIMNGTLKILSEKKIEFDGDINLYTNNCCDEINEKGKFIFVKSGKRKYWRLQDRSRLCDVYKCCYYLDIFE